MKVSATTLMLAAALGVAARPSGHGHKEVHRSMERRLDYVINKKPDVPVATKATVAPITTTSQAPPPPASTLAQTKPTSSPGSGSGGAKKQFCGGNKKRATAAEIFYKGNIGTAGNYGCNLMMVDSASGYDYTATFENKSGKDQKCVAWLKFGRDGKLTGFFEGNQAFTFDLPAGSKKVMAAEANSQGGVACGPGKYTLSGIKQFADTWLEFDFANESNKNFSGADVSCLVASDNNLFVQAMKVCADGYPCSTIEEGGKGTNAYVAHTHALDGVGLNVRPGPIALKVTVG